MIPPIPPDILSSNPQFAALHKTLTTKILDHDASTKVTNASHQSLENQVTKRLNDLTRKRILGASLHDTIFTEGENALPEESRELVYILSTYLLTTSPLTPAQTELLTLDSSRLIAHLPNIAPLLSRTLTFQHTHLHNLAKVSTQSLPADKLSRYSLQVHLRDTLSHLSTLTQLTIPSATTTLINTLTTLLALQTQHLTLTLTHLSRHVHGTRSRYTLSKSHHQATISRTLASKTQILALEAQKSTYSPQTQAALMNYAAHLDELQQRLDKRIRTLQDERRLYEECDGKQGGTMQELARRYGDVLRETEEVKADVERLERDGKSGKKDSRKVSRTNYEIP